MSWFKVDDKLHSHPKVLGVPLRAMGLWVLAGAWSADQLTDGFIPRAVLPTLQAKPADARDLVTSGLWLEVDGGWQFHDWLEFQFSRASTLARRAKDAERKAEARAAKAAKREEEERANLRAIR